MISDGLHPTIVTAKNGHSAVAEKFHIFSSNLLTMREQIPVQTIIMTSATRQEGTSTITANLAVSLTYDNQKVLLIDANFHNPIQHHLFGITNRSGFQEYLSAYAPLKEVIQNTLIPRLDVITSGPIRVYANGTHRFSQVSLFLRDIVEEYDFILIDTPSVNTYSDAQNMIRFADVCLLVVRSDHTTTHEVRQASKRILSVNGKLTGVILNDYT